jgi:hypothetical protein
MIFLKRIFGALSALVLYLKANIQNTLFFDHEYSLSPIEIVVISNYVSKNIGNFGTKREPVV